MSRSPTIGMPNYGDVTITNHGDTVRDITLTSYAELVLGSAAADAAHPAFSKMFVQTESVEGGGILLATRRRRAPGEAEVWAAHCAVVEAQEPGSFEFETDRARFLGRGRTLRNARAMQVDGPLSNTTGSVLDPIFSLRRRVSVQPRASVRVAFWTLVANSRDAAIALCAPLRAPDACEKCIAGAAEHAATQRARFGLDRAQAERYGQLVGALLSADPAWRSAPEVLELGSGGPPVLWTCGISGDRPIVLLRIAGERRLDRVRELLRAQLHWRSQQFGRGCGFAQLRRWEQHRPSSRYAGSPRERAKCATPGSSRRARRPVCSPCTTMKSRTHSATDSLLPRGSFLTQPETARTGRRKQKSPRIPSGLPDPFRASRDGPTPSSTAPSVPIAPLGPLEFENGTGGFDSAAREYAITLTDGRCTPMPWINVVANSSFGFLVSAEGGGYTWSINSQQNPLTPWPNDPVSDVPHEIMYLRDEDSGELWSATALPIRVPSAIYTARHGKGYSRFAHDAHEIEHRAVAVRALDRFDQAVATAHSQPFGARAALVHHRVCRMGTRSEWNRASTVYRHHDGRGDRRAIRAQPWRAEFGDRVAFVDLGGVQSSADRRSHRVSRALRRG